MLEVESPLGIPSQFTLILAGGHHAPVKLYGASQSELATHSDSLKSPYGKDSAAVSLAASRPAFARTTVGERLPDEALVTVLSDPYFDMLFRHSRFPFHVSQVRRCDRTREQSLNAQSRAAGGL